uniref:(+)-lariciresinol reductase n=1 Tax=Quercus lobata TaxID=97700 RepID=A0A7N2N3I3_QUELO
MEKSKVLVVGGTGYIGKRLVKEQGAHLVPGSFSDHQSLVNAVKLVDVVICAIAGVHVRSHQILLQLKLVDANKDAGNVKVIPFTC